MTHELKTWPKAFQAVWYGKKAYELRKNDRDYQVGDYLHLREWDKENGYSGRGLLVEVTYMSKGPDWGLPKGMCVMSIRIRS